MWLSVALCEWGEPDTSASTGSSQGAWHSSHGLLNGEICGKVSCPWELPFMLSTPAVLMYRDPLSSCVRHSKDRRVVSVGHLPSVVSPSGITTFCFMSGFGGFSGYNVASVVKACGLCLSERTNQAHLGRAVLLRKGGSFFQRMCCSSGFRRWVKEKKQQQGKRSSTDGKQDWDWPSNNIKITPTG